MAETIRPGTQIRDFTPDDTDILMYLSCEFQTYSMATILKAAQEKWGADIKLEDIKVSSEYIQCYCLGYDRYDASDYVNYLVIVKLI